MKNKRSNFEVGDKVWSLVSGWGKVVAISRFKYTSYPVNVAFDKGKNYIEFFTKDGKSHVKDINQTIFFEELEIPESALVKPKWRAKSGCLYFYVDSDGTIERAVEDSNGIDSGRFEQGNYFQTEKEAKESKFYKVFHDIGERNV